MAVRATAPAALPSGARVKIALRPERIRIAGSGADGLPARVTEAIYAGNATTLMLDAQGDYRIRLRIPAGAGLPEPRIGEAVSLQWDAVDARVFEADS